jgi:hypothetical protein
MRLFKAATQELEELLHDNRNDCIQIFLKGVTPTKSTDYSLWKATKKLEHVNKPSPPLRTSHLTWARSNVDKAHAFAKRPADVFSRIRQEMDLQRKMHLANFLRPLTSSNRR